MKMRTLFDSSIFFFAAALSGCADIGTMAEAAEDVTAAEQALGLHFWDYGKTTERILNTSTLSLFGFRDPVPASAPPTDGAFRSPTQSASDQLLLARGLHARYLTREAGDLADMFAFWPSDAQPDFLVFCVEGARQIIGSFADGRVKYNPSVQVIDAATGAVTTLLRGMDRCDGIRTTPWGTVLATEETSDGGAYEIIDPLAVVDAAVLTRGAPGAPASIDDDRIVKRTLLPTMAWEGLAVLGSGVVIAGDELRPGTGVADSDGGALFKFVPDEPADPGARITHLDDSPLASGTSHALQVSCVSGRQQHGQGCEVGRGAWIPVAAATARADAEVQGATGYYRPEDLHQDLRYQPDPSTPAAVRFCWANTGNDDAEGYGEVVCGVDSDPLVAAGALQSVGVNRFIEGDPDFNSFDNLAFQDVSGNLYVIEDHDNGDIFACLPDGGDRDIKSDGCVRVLSVADSSAEPTGFAFTADGKTAYLSIQHSNDDAMPRVDDYRTDDILVITGFQTFGRR